MNMSLDDAVDDLKQFIIATLSQELTGAKDELRGEMANMRDELRTDLRHDIQQLDDKLSKKIDDLSASVAEAMDANGEATDSQLQDHERRIARLEHKAA